MHIEGQGSQGCDLGHLTYCTNIHAGETWDEIFERLQKNLPVVKAEASPSTAMGVGLRLSSIAADALIKPAALEAFKAFLQEGGFYVFTINGFPYGPFHGQRVKEQVYQPDWSFGERLMYSNRLADILASILPAGIDGSVSTVPGTFKPLAAELGRIDKVTDHLIHHAAHLVGIERQTGHGIILALEPEPCCFLETIEETVDYFEQHLFSASSKRKMAALSGLSEAAAEDALHRHLGVCYDVCHAAVEYEDAAQSVQALRAAGIGIPKLQLSAALRIPKVTAETPQQLAPFDEPVYLHQVIERRGDGFMRYMDLAAALASIDQALGREWRVHFHVPIFLDQLDHFSTTQDFLKEILALHRTSPISQHLEVETYTWDVLPERYRGIEVSAAIAREMNWVRQELS